MGFVIFVEVRGLGIRKFGSESKGLHSVRKTVKKT